MEFEPAVPAIKPPETLDDTATARWLLFYLFLPYYSPVDSATQNLVQSCLASLSTLSSPCPSAIHKVALPDLIYPYT